VEIESSKSVHAASENIFIPTKAWPDPPPVTQRKSTFALLSNSMQEDSMKIPPEPEVATRCTEGG